MSAQPIQIGEDESVVDAIEQKFATKCPVLVPIITVGCFAGMCPDQSTRLEWEMIDLVRKHFDVPAPFTKDGERRIVDMSDNLNDRR